MVRALQLVSVERGYDPRELTLIAFGGAGPMHAAQLAEELGCPRVVIPPEAGVQSAWGLLVANCQRDYSQSFLCRADAVEMPVLKKLFDSLATRGRAELRAAGFADKDIRHRLAVDVRYIGQAYEVAVTLPGQPTFTKAMVGTINRAFHEAHCRLYGHSDFAAPVEWVTVRVAVIAQVPRPAKRKLAAASTPLAKRRYAMQSMVWNGKHVSSPVYHRGQLGAGDRVRGPALIIQAETTVAVPTGTTAQVEATGDIILKR